LIIGANKNYNLTINSDGSVSVNTLKIGDVRHTSAESMPGDDAPKGSIVWNSAPKLGEAVGWVSLGSARWASFGPITA